MPGTGFHADAEPERRRNPEEVAAYSALSGPTATAWTIDAVRPALESFQPPVSSRRATPRAEPASDAPPAAAIASTEPIEASF
jgi:hypothetical protein